jgi:hypothetical protein
MQETILLERRFNAIRRRDKQDNIPIRGVKFDYGTSGGCGNADRSPYAIGVTCYFGFNPIDNTPEKCKRLLADDSKKRKPPKTSCDPQYQVTSCVHVAPRR